MGVRHLKVALLLLLVLLFVLVSPQIVRSLKYADSDFFSFWLAARMTWKDQNPYDSSSWILEHQTYGADWISDSTYLYPLPLSVIFAPLGLLPLFEAYVLWVFLSLLTTIGSLLLLRTVWLNLSLTLSEMIPMIAGALLFRPVIVTVRNGQIGAILLLLVVLALYLWERERWLSGGVLIGATLLKPSLGIPVAVFIGLWAILARRWRIVAGFSLGVVGLYAIGWLQAPGWVNQYLAIAIGKGNQTLGFAPSLWGLAGLACSDVPACILASGLVSTTLLLMMILTVFMRWRGTMAPRLAVGIAISAALLVTPYLWAYDQILLLVPIVVLSMEMREQGYPYIATAPLLLVCSLCALLLVYVASILGRDAWSAALSFLVLIGIIWSHERNSHVTCFKAS